MQKKLLTVFFLMLTVLMLLYSKESLYFALTGLDLWFQKMIPALFPFMILSGIMVRMNLTEGFSRLFYPFFGPLFRLQKNAVYCMIMGFFCGFPMGARVIIELYERERLTRKEAQYLLSFCNNIGPIYFVSFVLPTIGMTTQSVLCLIGMYGLPLLYGLVLRYTVYRTSIPTVSVSIPKNVVSENAKQNILYHVDDAIQTAIHSITVLGGYMILFNLLNLIPYVILSHLELQGSLVTKLSQLLNGLLEITSGISRMGSNFPLAALILLPLGGLSCIAQTYSIIRHTDLSLGSYIRHKGVLTLITIVYYSLLIACGLI